MENLEASTYEQYIPESESNSEYDTDSDDSDRVVQTHNIGYHNVHHDREHTFLNDTKMKDYETSRNDLFTPKLSKVRILIDSKNMVTHDNERNTSNYVVEFENENSSHNNTNGLGNYKNLIAFRLIKAIIPNSIYNVNNNNNRVDLYYGDPIVKHEITFTNGSYTFSELGDHFKDALNTAVTGTPFAINNNTVSYKYELTNSTQYYFDWTIANSAWRLVGAIAQSETVSIYTSTRTFPNVVQHTSHYVDLVIPQIPYIACKHNPKGKHIVERIPLSQDSGSLVYHVNDEIFENYFYPFELSKLNVILYDDSGDQFYECQNNDNSFEFELTIMNY
tara:strand:- start:1224 stop:2225 length:1002 start_codon:yes stop_codon:yes gene_type:complete